MFEKLRTVDPENTPLLPQRVKNGSVSGSALLTSSVRNHARSAFKRFSPHCPSLIRRGGKGQRSKSEGSDAISVYFTHKITDTQWERVSLNSRRE